MTNLPQEAFESKLNWFDANRAYLVQQVEYLKYLLKTSYPEFSSERTDKTTAKYRIELEKLRDSIPGVVPVEYLAEMFNLSEFEKSILLLAVAHELDSSFLKPLGEDKPIVVNFSLALAILPDACWDSLIPDGALRKSGLLEVEVSTSLTASKISVPESVLHFIIGVRSEDKTILSVADTLTSRENYLDKGNGRIAENIFKIWTNLHDLGSSFFSLTGENAEIKRDIALTLAESLNLQIKFLPSFLIPKDLKELQSFVSVWDREILLSEYLLMIDCNDEKESDTEQLRMVDYFIDKLKWPVICSTSGKRISTRKEQFSFEVLKPGVPEQQLYWESLLSSNEHISQIAEVSSHFDLSFSDIHTSATEIKSSVESISLWDVCRKNSKTKMGSLAQKIEPSLGSLDLILPDREKVILEDIVNHVKLRSTVYQDWGLLKNSSRGQGVTVLFAGASGTGKTTAAECLSLRLNLDLYRIDLSCIVSKYIGETEKNLQQIFLSAEKSGAILLFDEADALFGKRTQVKDSNDRHANNEVSYLLQRMESFRGLAILTSNFRDSFDKAFLRRLRFIVQFPFPSTHERELIWQAMLPQKAPSKGIDFKKLAQLNVAGGNIRNITMNACFGAAASKEPLQMKHYLKASREEYLKLEKNITEEEVRGWV